MKFERIFFLFCLAFFFNPQGIFCSLQSKLNSEVPKWVKHQIQKDLSQVQIQPISHKSLIDFYANHPELNLIKVLILNNQISLEGNCSNALLQTRGTPIYEALSKLAQTIALPNVLFLLSLGDGLTAGNPAIPIFCLAKNKTNERLPLILFPDSDNLRAKYQVIENGDVTLHKSSWKKKIPQLIWRGSTAQYSYSNPRETTIRKDNLHGFSRIKLCELSQRYPDLIDAKFTIFSQGAEDVPQLHNFLGDWKSYNELFKYKYQILIDGNTCPWSNSGWKFFTNSLIFKAESDWIQWYCLALTPNVHYIPVKNNLDDLVERIVWALFNEEAAEAMASRMFDFAVENLTVESSLVYIYQLLLSYSRLQFSE